MKLHPLNKIKLAGTIIGVIALGLVVGIKAPDYAKASANNNVHGWLWSDMPTGSDQAITPSNQSGGRGFGYVSLNSDDPGMSGNYGVSLDLATGELSGQGWSEYGGWLDFDPSGTPPNALGNSAIPATLDGSCLTGPQTVCPVLGWAKFLSGGSAQSGGWDGWVSLQGINPNYGIKYDKATGRFSGVAWGGTVVGWINFDNVFVDMVPPLSCADPVLGTVYTYTDPANPPAQCAATPGMSVCYSEPGHIGHFYAAGTTPPSVCTVFPPSSPSVPPVDLCSNLAAIQSILPTFINGIWYNDPNNDRMCTEMTNPPIMGCTDRNAENPTPFATIDDGSCTYGPGGPGGPEGPIKPIYKEN
jgi:hypothetical protein